MGDIAYINGEFVELQKARISIEDRGFQFGDSIYDVIKLYSGKLFRLEDHLDRLFYSAQRIKLDIGYTKEEFKKLIYQLLAHNDESENRKKGSLYIQITRGTAPRSHSFASDLTPTIIMYLLPKSKNLPLPLRENGVTAVTIPDKRWGYCDIKTTNLLPNILGKQEAKKQGAFEGIFVTDENKVTEATSSNLFIVKEGVIKTHPLTEDILGGITRKVVLELARKKFTIKEEEFTVEDLYQADEVFITGTIKEVLGVVKIDEKQISDAKVGTITKEIYKDYRNYVENFKAK